MTRYNVFDPDRGGDLGVFHAEVWTDALDQLAQKFGHSDYPAARAAGQFGKNLVITEVQQGCG